MLTETMTESKIQDLKRFQATIERLMSCFGPRFEFLYLDAISFPHNGNLFRLSFIPEVSKYSLACFDFEDDSCRILWEFVFSSTTEQ
jgi:hypothetical protein